MPRIRSAVNVHGFPDRRQRNVGHPYYCYDGVGLLLRDSKDELLEFTFAEQDAARFVFCRQELIDSTDEILDDNGIRNQCSAALEPLWAKK